MKDLDMYTLHLGSDVKIAMTYYAEYNGGEMQFDTTNESPRKFACANVTPKAARLIIRRLERFIADVERRKAKSAKRRTIRSVESKGGPNG